jgi:hypothetical protein
MFSVFVEGPRDPGPSAIRELARVIASRYGLPQADIEARIANGRFRVKANVDRKTAEQYAFDLERLGARCSIIAVEPSAITPPPMSKLTLPPPKREERAPSAKTPMAPSGLSAAGGGSAQDLGALGRDAPIALSALDGSDGAAPAPRPASFAPPPSQHEMFSPPDDEAPVELAIDIDEDRARRRGTAAPPAATVPPPAADAITEPPPESFSITPAGRSPLDRVKDWLADDRRRLVTGVGLVLLLGFVPAHVFASIREGSTFGEIDSRLVERQVAASTAEQWDQLDKVRAAMLDRKHGERRDIALTAILIWAAVAGGLGYVWFRRVDWDRVLS